MGPALGAKSGPLPDLWLAAGEMLLQGRKVYLDKEMISISAFLYLAKSDDAYEFSSCPYGQ
jgi:hypothetical protein